LARELEAAGGPRLDDLVLEEDIGAIPVQLIRHGGTVVGAEFRAPPVLVAGPPVAIEDAAACLSLAPEDIRRNDPAQVDPPQVLSVGLPFLVVAVASREILSRAKPSLAAHERVLPPIGTDSVFAYAEGSGPEELHARMFSPLDGIVEDPATGSAVAATLALLAAQRPEREAKTLWRVEQGVDMRRPSLILGRTCKRDGIVTAVHVGGHAVAVMSGTLQID
jgi:trans-2,3-dihydro-3-hydroxyanthranilate isomerase